MASKKLRDSAAGRPRSLPSEKRTIVEVHHHRESRAAPALGSIDQLRKENESLRDQLNEARRMLNQLLAEAPNENYSQRRVALLKAQLYQTERQLLLLQDGMARRTGAIWEAENTLQNVKSQCQSLATSNTESSTHTAACVSVPRPLLFRLIEDVEKARGALFRRLQREADENRFHPLHIPNRYMAPSVTDANSCGVIDVLTGKKPMLQLQKVAELESEVFNCLEEVAKLNINLDSYSNGNNAITPISIHHSRAFVENLSQQADRTKSRLESLGNQLLESSILVPLSVQLPPSRPDSSSTKEMENAISPSSPDPHPSSFLAPNQSISAKAILAKFPKQTIPKSRLKEVSAVLQSFVKVSETQRRFDALHLDLIRNELDDAKRLLEVQNEFAKEVIDMAEKSYHDFYETLTIQFQAPVAQVLDSFQRMEAEANEENLRFFLLRFREHYEALTSLGQYLRGNANFPPDTSQLFQMLHANFEQSIKDGLHQLSLKRDARVAEIYKVKEEINGVRKAFSTVSTVG